MTVVDTGPLVALADSDDGHHAACARWYDSVHPRNLVIPAPVIAEACHLIGTRCGAQVEAAFRDALAAGQLGIVTGIMPDDIERMAHRVRQYASLPLGGTDACVVAIAERWQAKQVATVDTSPSYDPSTCPRSSYCRTTCSPARRALSGCARYTACRSRRPSKLRRRSEGF